MTMWKTTDANMKKKTTRNKGNRRLEKQNKYV